MFTCVKTIHRFPVSMNLVCMSSQTIQRWLLTDLWTKNDHRYVLVDYSNYTLIVIILYTCFTIFTSYTVYVLYCQNNSRRYNTSIDD